MKSTLYIDGEKVADLDNFEASGKIDDINVGGDILTQLRTGFTLLTKFARRYPDGEEVWETCAAHEEITNDEWVVIGSSPSFLAATICHRIWIHALEAGDNVIESYVFMQYQAMKTAKDNK